MVHFSTLSGAAPFTGGVGIHPPSVTVAGLPLAPVPAAKGSCHRAETFGLASDVVPFAEREHTNHKDRCGVRTLI